MDIPEERPQLRVLMARANLMHNRPPVTVVVDLFEVEARRKTGFVFVALDPADQEAWDLWRAAHPEAV